MSKKNKTNCSSGDHPHDEGDIEDNEVKLLQRTKSVPLKVVKMSKNKTNCSSDHPHDEGDTEENENKLLERTKSVPLKVVKMSKNKTNCSSDHPHDEGDIEDNVAKLQDVISRLRVIVSEEKNLKVRMDDSFMLRYLRASEYRPIKAFQKMVKVYKFKAKYGSYFCSKSPLEYEDLLSQNFITMLEDRDESGRRIILVKIGDIVTNATPVKECIRLNDIFMETALEDEETQRNGIVMILDVGGRPMRLFKFLSLKATIISALKEEMRPWKRIDIHVVNTAFLVKMAISTLYSLLGSKIKEHIYFHGEDWASLHKFISPDVLPEEYGGRKPEVDFQKMRKYLYDNEEKLKELFSLGYVKS